MMVSGCESWCLHHFLAFEMFIPVNGTWMTKIPSRAVFSDIGHIGRDHMTRTSEIGSHLLPSLLAMKKLFKKRCLIRLKILFFKSVNKKGFKLGCGLSKAEKKIVKVFLKL